MVRYLTIEEARNRYQQEQGLLYLPPYLREALTPWYPPGTEQYDRYRGDLKVALDEWVNS